MDENEVRKKKERGKKNIRRCKRKRERKKKKRKKLGGITCEGKYHRNPQICRYATEMTRGKTGLSYRTRSRIVTPFTRPDYISLIVHGKKATHISTA